MDANESSSISLPGSSKRENDGLDPNQPYKKCKLDQNYRYTLSEREIGSMFDRGDFDTTFIWKISNVSSIPQEVDYVVCSPSFSYEGASFILKICPYGQSESGTEGYIDFKIERVHSEIEKHVINTKLYCGSPFNKVFKQLDERFTFDASCSEETLCKFLENPKVGPKKWQFAPNDVFTLVVAFSIFSKVKSDETAVGKTRTRSKCARGEEYGEVFKDSFNLKCFYWKVCGLLPRETPLEDYERAFPEDCQVESQLLFFANATWILKLYLYFRMPQSNNPSFDVVLERLFSETPDHYVILQLVIDYSIQDEAMGSFFFNEHHAHRNVISFKLKDKDIPELICLHFSVNIYVKTNDRTEVISLMKFAKPSAVIDNVLGSLVHQKNKVLQDYKELFRQQEDCDVVIKVKGQDFLAHRVILKARSPVLASTFQVDMKEKTTGVVDVEDCDPSTFSDFLCFLYCGELENLSEDNVFSLFTAADKYDVPDLRTVCMEFMKQNLSIDTFCDTFALALQHSEAELIKFSTDFFVKNLQEIIVTVKWKSFIVENPIQGNELIIKALVPNRK